MGEGLGRARAAARATRPPTPNEVRFLTGLLQPAPAPRSRQSWWTVSDLILCQPERFGDCSAEGLHRTGSSCARKGLADKQKRRGKIPVMYRTTPAGRAAIENSLAESRTGGNPE